MERIDPVRYITNDSSGKMGFAIAEAARQMGAEVTLVTGKTTAAPPEGMKIVSVESAEEMLDAVMIRFEETDIVIKAAAVADYRPVETHIQKLKKKNEDRLTLTLVKNPDILQELGRRKKHQFFGRLRG